MKIVLIISLFATLCLNSQIYAASKCRVINKPISALDNMYKSGQFRIYYSSNPASKDYIQDQTDHNRNNIPDYVENIAIQANATTSVLTHLGFIHPLESKRYKNITHYIDIYLYSISGNGVAYDYPGNWVSESFKEKKCALSVAVRNNLENFPGRYWTTVTHELFHLYQYGYSQFKGGWYLEGMTNWAERSLRIGAVGRSYDQQLPQTQDELEKIYNTPYNHLWHRLAVLSDPGDGTMHLSRELLNRRYVDGSKVFKDDKLRGHKFIKRVLENFAQASDKKSKEQDWSSSYWAEKDQRSELNRPIMLKAIQKTMKEFGMNQTVEENNFLKLK